METIKYKCPLCGTTDLKKLNGYEECCGLVKCKDCGLVYATIQPSEEKACQIYDSYGRDDYLSEVTIKRYNELLDIFEKYRNTNNILDVGCGIGYFLEVAKSRGWNVYGTEFSDRAVEICEQKGIVMHKGTLDSVDYIEGQFDVITSFEVLEHVAYPDDIMKCVKFLRVAGATYFTTPNFNSIIRRYQKSECDILSKNDHPEHITFFTKKSMRRLLLKYGLKPVFVHTHGISISRIRKYKQKKKGGQVTEAKYISKNSTDEKLRVSIEKSTTKRYLKRFINFILSILGIGDSLKVLAEKR